MLPRNGPPLQVDGVNALLGALAQEADHGSALEVLEDPRQLWDCHVGKQ